MQFFGIYAQVFASDVHFNRSSIWNSSDWNFSAFFGWRTLCLLCSLGFWNFFGNWIASSIIWCRVHLCALSSYRRRIDIIRWSRFFKIVNHAISLANLFDQMITNIKSFEIQSSLLFSSSLRINIFLNKLLLSNIFIHNIHFRRIFTDLRCISSTSKCEIMLCTTLSGKVWAQI